MCVWVCVSLWRRVWSEAGHVLLGGDCQKETTVSWEAPPPSPSHQTMKQTTSTSLPRVAPPPW